MRIFHNDRLEIKSNCSLMEALDGAVVIEQILILNCTGSIRASALLLCPSPLPSARLLRQVDRVTLPAASTFQADL